MKHSNSIMLVILGIFSTIMIILALKLKYEDFLNFTDFLSIIILLIILTYLTIGILEFLRDDTVSHNFELFLGLIFLFALISTALLTYLLWKNIVPIYLNSIYILLGSLMIAVVGIFLNRKVDVDRENKKIKRVTSVIDNVIVSNTTLAKEHISILSKFSEYRGLTLLRNFWDILNTNITNVDLEPDYVQSLLSLKELSLGINDEIKEREIYLSKFPELKAIEGTDLDILRAYNQIIGKKGFKLIKESEGHLKKYNINNKK